jgi:hypothetical protein
VSILILHFAILLEMDAKCSLIPHFLSLRESIIFLYVKKAGIILNQNEAGEVILAKKHNSKNLLEASGGI